MSSCKACGNEKVMLCPNCADETSADEIERLRARVAEVEADRDRWKAEAMAWRAWHDDTSDRGTGWLMELTTNVDKARAANDANERGEG